MKKLYKKQTKQTLGITLIALVVTIVVLLILAGVSLNLVLGNNGIITKAKEASRKYEQAAENEQINMAEFEEEFNALNDQKELKLLISSGDSGEVDLTGLFSNGTITISWGDGSEDRYSDVYRGSGGMSSVEDKIHSYEQLNKEYTVTVSGKLHYLELYNNNSIIEVLHWGQTGMKSILMYDCKNLVKVAQPTVKSFEELVNCNCAFSGCSSLRELPKGLFKYANKVTDFAFAFKGCTSLTYIPEDTFKGCSNVKHFESTFVGCSNLENYLPLWEQAYYKDGNENMSETTGGEGCYANCSKLSTNGSYSNIPSYWRDTPSPR